MFYKFFRSFFDIHVNRISEIYSYKLTMDILCLVFQREKYKMVNIFQILNELFQFKTGEESMNLAKTLSMSII